MWYYWRLVGEAKPLNGQFEPDCVSNLFVWMSKCLSEQRERAARCKGQTCTKPSDASHPVPACRSAVYSSSAHTQSLRSARMTFDAPSRPAATRQAFGLCYSAPKSTPTRLNRALQWKADEILQPHCLVWDQLTVPLFPADYHIVMVDSRNRD